MSAYLSIKIILKNTNLLVDLFILKYIYIYIYIYICVCVCVCVWVCVVILWQFRFITHLQYGLTGEMLLAVIVTRLTLRQSAILPHRHSRWKWRTFYQYLFTYMLSVTCRAQSLRRAIEYQLLTISVSDRRQILDLRTQKDRVRILLDLSFFVITLST